MSVAVVTMFHNEPEYLPIWIKYYSRQVGPENCFVIDHGSSDASSVYATSVNLIRIPSSPQDEVKRVETISDFASMLHRHFDHVIYTDVDEILVADPEGYSDLLDFCGRMEARVAVAIGLNVHQLVGEEPSFDPTRPVLVQRTWVRFVSPMCKPLVASVPVRWKRGFHACDAPCALGNIYLFHLRWFDLEIGLRRLNRTRTLPRQTHKDEEAAKHQRIADHEFEAMMRQVTGFRKRTDVTFSPTVSPMSEWLERAFVSGSLDYGAISSELWRIPERFVDAF